MKRGLAGKFAASVIAWYVFSSTLAGFFGLLISSLIFNIPFSLETAGAWSEAANMLRAFKDQSGASFPLIAILGAFVAGFAAVWIDPLYRFLSRIEKAMAGMSLYLGSLLSG